MLSEAPCLFKTVLKITITITSSDVAVNTQFRGKMPHALCMLQGFANCTARLQSHVAMNNVGCGTFGLQIGKSPRELRTASAGVFIAKQLLCAKLLAWVLQTDLVLQS